MTAARPPLVSLVLEQTLGHRTHTQNIERALGDDHAPRYAVHHVAFGHAGRLPWALRGSALALRAVASERAAVTFFHTQTVALLAPLAARGRPYVVSVDATPLQVDAMGRWYQHQPGSYWAERAKRAWYQRVFRGASAIVAWSAWAAASLRSDYGVSDTPIEVIHPGAPDSFFSIEHSRESIARPTVLFVGGDFVRKGGPQLIEAFEPLHDRANLVIVTEDPIAVPPWAHLLRGVQAGSPEHRRVFADADLFCLPTLGDCTPLVIGEAMAAGLPVLTTTVGSNEESVGAGGVLVPAGDAAALGRALQALIASPDQLRAMGHAARARAAEHMHAERNAGRILALLARVAERGS